MAGAKGQKGDFSLLYIIAKVVRLWVMFSFFCVFVSKIFRMEKVFFSGAVERGFASSLRMHHPPRLLPKCLIRAVQGLHVLLPLAGDALSPAPFVAIPLCKSDLCSNVASGGAWVWVGSSPIQNRQPLSPSTPLTHFSSSQHPALSGGVLCCRGTSLPPVLSI